MSSPDKVDFPSAGSDIASTPFLVSPETLATHLPFRRMSLPAPPSLNLNRQSVISLASFESLSESGTPQSPISSPIKKSRSGRTPIEVQRKGLRRRGYRPPDEEREAKRRKVIEEFCETERTYVQGLDLIYELFLTPIIAALDTPHSLLDRADLTSIFSNFVDIWNLHRAFFSSLNEHLHTFATPDAPVQLPSSPPPRLSPVLLSHFPYLSLYTPFVTSFSASLATLTTLFNTNSAFSAFVARQETDPRCGKLKLRDWLLTIVQRCPRYLLLLKDLINCTDTEDPEYASLMSVHTLVSKITTSLNASLHTHAQTLALLALQRNTPNLPFQLVAPGRTFLKRGSLLQFERGSSPKERDFLLFSDCLLWIANLDRGDSEPAERWDWKGVKTRPPPRPMMARSRSRSEVELSALRSRAKTGGSSLGFLPTPQSTSPTRPSPSVPSSRSVVCPTRMKKRQASSGNCEDRWWFKGKAELVDLEIVVTAPTEVEEESRFEVWSPEGSFAVYAASEDERDAWSTAIRNAKAALLASLNVTRPNSTLSSSASTNHLRRTLQALPHLPEDAKNRPRRGRVEHFVPAVWIPDGRTESCMRCGRLFGWRRRRHHCRLCGRCVCASCSGSTFYILDSDAKDPGKPARACDACYETVFPVITPSTSLSIPSSTPTFTLSSFPSWQSTPALAATRPPSLLMAFDQSMPKRALTRIDDVVDDNVEAHGLSTEDGGEQSESTHPVIRVRPASRPRSFLHTLENFQEEKLQVTPSSSTFHSSPQTDESTDVSTSPRSGFFLSNDSGAPSLISLPPAASSPTTLPAPRAEDTVRRQKRFSLPIVGLQMTPVTARANTKGEGLAKRFSLVLGGGRTIRGSNSTRVHGKGLDQEAGEGTVRQSQSTGHGVAATRLADLLGRRKAP
ncbi:hypothetical protein BJV78DRAFT_1129549 [Lactifluus subvellereus]|nr:hypothetical protein BJV78DRAFT_1129549 [Lactifluus subvellereus]